MMDIYEVCLNGSNIIWLKIRYKSKDAIASDTHIRIRIFSDTVTKKQQVAKELHKPVTRKFEKRDVS